MTNEDQKNQEGKRRARLLELIDPASTAVLTMELQRGVVGPSGMLKALVEEVARAGTVAAAGSVCSAARACGVRVVHCTAEFRADGAGATKNCKIFAMSEKLRREQGIVSTEIGTEGAELMPELGEDPRDIKIARMHGMTPFTSTSLDQMLRNLGVKTVVVTGVSINLGMMGLCLNALDLGYQTVLVRDAVAGVPREYVDQVIEHTLSLITTITTSEELGSIWGELEAR
jgi:biuret amidohydrolase